MNKTTNPTSTSPPTLNAAWAARTPRPRTAGYLPAPRGHYHIEGALDQHRRKHLPEAQPGLAAQQQRPANFP